MLTAQRLSTHPPSRPVRKPTPHVLFVDDEPAVLRGIGRLLGASEPTWQLSFANSGSDALAALEESAFDVVVSDLNMPRMDGATLLSEVQKRHPDIVRLVLSGMSSPSMVFRTVPVAHQFLTKPFEPIRFRSTLREAFELRSLLGDPVLRALAGKKNRLPSPPKTFAALQQALANPRASVRDVGSIIEKDIALSAQLVRLASSAFFGLPSRVCTPHGAVAYLGFETIKAVVLSAELMEMFRPNVPSRDFDVEKLQRDAVCTAHLARRILAGTGMGDDAFLAGMVHEVGVLLLAARTPTQLSEVKRLERSGVPPLDAEREVLGVTHAELGAYLLGLWGFPHSVIHAVASHWQPQRSLEPRLGVSLAVSIAARLAKDPETALEEEPLPGAFTLDGTLLRLLGLTYRLDDWRGYARKTTEET